MSEPISTRIRLKWSEGGDLAYFTDKEVLDSLGVQADEEFTDTFLLSIGTILHLEDGDVRIVHVSTIFYRNTYDNSGNKGTNLYGFGERYPFNFQITYTVESV